VVIITAPNGINNKDQPPERMLPAITNDPPIILAQSPAEDETAFMTAMVNAEIGFGDALVVN
jgi:hypothetical protein